MSLAVADTFLRKEKVMKKYAILTSVFALTACGGGSGHHHSPITPDNNPIVGEETTLPEVFKSLPAQVDNKAEVVAYVESRLGTDYYDVPADDAATDADTGRHATTRNAAANSGRRVLTLDEKYAQARAKLDAMNDTLSKMLAQSDTEKFVSDNKTKVEEALKLFGLEINVGDAIEKIVEKCKDVTKEALEQVKQRHELATQKISDIDFLVATPSSAGTQSIVKLTMDKQNKISGISIIDDIDDPDTAAVATRIGDTTVFRLPRVYGYVLPNIWNETGGKFEQLSFDVYEDLSLEEIKKNFLVECERVCDDMGCDDKERQALKDKINKLTAADRNAEIEGFNTGFIATSEQSDIDVYTQGDKLGMKYADFGYVIANTNRRMDNESADETTYEAFAGGYDVKRIDKQNLSDEMVFAGRAVGGVRYETLHWADEGNEWDSKPLSTDDAKLTFKDGTETLNMNFADSGWYDVTVTSKDGKSDIVFAKESQVDGENYKFRETSVSDFTSRTDGYEDDGVIGKFRTDYYGDGGKPSEATAIVGFRETSWNDDDTGIEVEFSGAFGGKLK